MISNIKIKSLIAIALLSSLSSFSQQSDNPASETTADQVQHGFWKNPNLNYVSTAWPMDNDNIRIDHVPELENAFVDTAPMDRNDGLVMGELGIVSGDKDMIVKLAQEIAEGQHGKFDSLLIAHKDKLVFESYYLWGRVNLTHPQSSAVKTYTGLALGRAIQLGYLTMADLDKPLVSFLKGLDSTKFVKGTERLTLHQALTMRSGIRINDEQRKEYMKDPRQIQGQGLVQTILEQSTPITLESQSSFSYGNYSSSLVMQVIDAVVPGTAEDFIKNELLGKMGITTYEWLPGPAGLPSAGWKVSITSRAMAKIGTLAMNKGKWNGEQLIPETFITKAINRIVRHSDDENFSDDGDISNTGYGYFWWQADMKYGNKNYFSTSARGGGGQYIILIEELDLIVVMTGWHRGDDQNLQMTAERILPAFIKDKLPIIEGPYIGQNPPGLIPEVFAPGIVNADDWQLSGIFTPDLKEFYFIREVGEVEQNKKMEFVLLQIINNRWQESVISPRVGTPLIAPDGKTMHLGKRYMKRTNDGWSEVKSLGSPFDKMSIMRLSASSKGTYFFDEFKPDFTGSIRYSRLVDGKHEEPKLLSKNINGGKSFHPFIAPDESYLIFDGKREDGYGDSDLYISYRQLDGSWGEPINLGDKINTRGWEAVASVTPDGKYLFFSRNKNPENHEKVDILWVDAQIIETLRPKQ